MGSPDFLTIETEADFTRLALERFQYQYRANPVYSEYCRLLGVRPQQVRSVPQIPFLPITFFKSHKVLCGGAEVAKVFRSSGTTGSIASEHHVVSLRDYESSFVNSFKQFYGDPENYCIIGLLPTYAERGDASLAYMVSHLIERSRHPQSGFYLDKFKELRDLIATVTQAGANVLLIGVTFALLDFCERYPGPLLNTVVMETGGMKGKRPEMVREAVHAQLEAGFEIPEVHSEYGMTELLSQAYSNGEGIFSTPPWMRIFTREIEDPLTLQHPGKTGGVNVVDLANTHSCSFIATQDLGRVQKDGRFEILGRFDHADVRGCNLMIA